MTRGTAYTIYHESPPKMAFSLNEGAWTDDDKYKVGGYFATPMDKDTFVILDTASDATVKIATASTDVPIGKMISEPQGKHTTNGRQGTVLLFGSAVLEVEVYTSSDSIAIGGSVKFQASGGTFAEGVWTLDTASNDTRALAAYTTGSDAGTKIPVLFGAGAF